jgi:hypothetical protein
MTGFKALPAHARRERAALERAGCSDWPDLAAMADAALAELAASAGASLATLVRLRGQARLVVDLQLHPGQAALLLHAGYPDRRSLATADPEQLWRQTGRLQRRLTGTVVPAPDLAQVRHWIALARRGTN